MSSYSLSDLRKLLSGLQEIGALSDNSMKTLMDKYDISDVISGRNRSISYPQSVYQKPEDGFLFTPPITLQSMQTAWVATNPPSFPASYSYFTHPQIFTLGSNSPSVLYWTTSYVEENKETRLNREKEEAKKKVRFEQIIDKIGKAASEIFIDPNPPAAERSPDYIYTLTGWRGWVVEDGKLKALGTSNCWKPRKINPAICENYDHDAPQMDCSCGYWSFKSSDLMKKALQPYRERVMVVGSVEIWGKVIECENGFRSEFAYPKELWLLKPDLESLSWTYGVPVKRSDA